MPNGKTLSGTDEGDFAAGMQFCQIDIFGFDDDLIGCWQCAAARTNHRKSDRND
jgi:hypothetical protein